ncbi:TonB-dependent receptor [Pandoraea pulmonicola]|uniref:TonB-dependent receptor n=2 Tax=Pandoraea pulmonicola TaxID=93221 RepID=A0ABM5S403_PANPU|nr:TonB-dependent siderophore receptor [Pandoraea pulmonicola]AJC22491.1 TonB-dependent receptor [Pandoraea pulmonicola]
MQAGPMTLRRSQLSAALVGILSAQGAMAADAGTTNRNTAADVQLPSLNVTGERDSFKTDYSSSQKFTAPILDTPRAVTVIPEPLLQSTGSSTLTEALRTVPGITFGAGEGGNPLGDRPFLRGYDTQGSLFVDGMRDVGATTHEMFNTEAVEIVKGASGAYGGRGGAGGSVNIVSKEAKLGTFAEGTVGLGNAKYKRLTADGNWQVGDHAAFRLNLMGHDAGVAGRDAIYDSRWGIAPSVAFGLGTPTRVVASFYHMQSDGLPDSGIPYNYAPGRRTGPAAVNANNFYGLDNRDFRRTSSDIGTIKIEHDISPTLTVRNMTRYTKSSQSYIWTQPDDSQGNVANGKVWRRTNTRDSNVWSIANQTELFGEAHTGRFKHSFNIGAEFSRESSRKDTYTVASGSGSGATNSCLRGIGAASGYNCTSLYNPNPYDPWTGSIRLNDDPAFQRTLTAAVYGFDTIDLSKEWQINLGARVDRYSTDFTDTRANGGKTTSRDDTLFNWQAGVTYKPLPNGSIYASYATSSVPAGSLLGEGSEGQSLLPGRGGVGVNAADLAPEKNRSYEIGTKWNVLGERLLLTAALFYIETTNARVTMADNTYAMVGGKNVKGLELGFAGKLTDKWQVFGGYTYMKSELTDNGTGTAASNNGKQFPNTPRNSFSLWTTYDIIPAVTVGGGAFYTSSVFGDPANLREIPAYWRFDAMAAWRINKKITAQLNVQNIFNRRYFDQAYPAHYASMAPGRSAIVSLTARY